MHASDLLALVSDPARLAAAAGALLVATTAASHGLERVLPRLEAIAASTPSDLDDRGVRALRAAVPYLLALASVLDLFLPRIGAATRGRK